ncbi:hypothetical protein [Subtercola vilae]|nr:hypothetical protein [Subtercola vilae]
MNDQMPPTVFTARLSRATSNKLKLTVTDGPGEPLAVAVQGGADGVGSKLGVLFGFKNGGVGKHLVTFRGGNTLVVETRSGEPSVLVQNGEVIASLARGDESEVLLPTGETLFVIVPDPAGARTADAFHLHVYRCHADGQAREVVGALDVILTNTGWTFTAYTVIDVLDVLPDLTLANFARPLGTALRLPMQGVRLVLKGPLSDRDQAILVGVCVDLAIGLRPYVAAMRNNSSRAEAPSAAS